MTENELNYVNDRVDQQIGYFDSGAMHNQKWYRRLKVTSIVCNVLTTLIIGISFTVPDAYKIAMGITALVLSTLVLATYQCEEFYNFGAKWEKFRLVAEQLKSEKYLCLSSVGRYASSDWPTRERVLVMAVEQIIRGTDIAYFALMVDPGRRIERRLENLGELGKDNYDA
jgi:Protein of unknown function (DUF4231)